MPKCSGIVQRLSSVVEYSSIEASFFKVQCRVLKAKGSLDHFFLAHFYFHFLALTVCMICSISKIVEEDHKLFN